MPTQSLSYMLGANLIHTERQRAMEQLGDNFNLKEFHDTVLLTGVRPLPELQNDIRSWVRLNDN